MQKSISKKRKNKILKRQANVIHKYIKEQSVLCYEPHIFIKRVNLEYRLPVFLISSNMIPSLTQFAWDEYEVFEFKETKSMKKYLRKVLKHHDRILWDVVTLPSCKNFQFSVKG